MIKKTFAGASIIVALLLITLFFKKAPIDPTAYNPPPSPPMTGVLAPNDLLKKADLLALGKINGPEEVAVDRQGRTNLNHPAGESPAFVFRVVFRRVGDPADQTGPRVNHSFTPVPRATSPLTKPAGGVAGPTKNG